MSIHGDLRTGLERIYDMNEEVPLDGRELEVFDVMLGCIEVDWKCEIEEMEAWWGPKAVSVLKAFGYIPSVVVKGVPFYEC